MSERLRVIREIAQAFRACGIDGTVVDVAAAVAADRICAPDPNLTPIDGIRPGDLDEVRFFVDECADLYPTTASALQRILAAISDRLPRPN